MATEKNILKQWFRNGLKPTQEQFWAWMDSFWHKNEKIPQTSIEGLDKSLEAKAETTAVDAKANKDATGLDDDNIIAWKEALGVGELPSNIATVDEGEKVGNTHTKEQVAELLGEKLNAPIEEGTTNDYPYVVGVNEENESVKLPAGDLGKNVANSKPTSVAGAGLNMGAIWDIDTNGFPLRIKGLADKSSNPTFDKKLKINNDGEIGISNDVEAVINLPDSLNYSTGTPNFNINITKIEQTITAPSNPNFSNEIKEIMANLFDYELTPYSAEDYGIVGRSDLTIRADGYLNKIPQNLVTNKTYDANSDFVVKIENVSSSCAWVTGIRREASPNSNEYVRGGDCHKGYTLAFYIKKQNILFFIGYIGDGVWETSIWNIPVELGYIKLIISANKVSYKILN